MLAAAVYLAFYVSLSFPISAWFGQYVDAENILATPASIFIGLALPILIGAIVLLCFIGSLGWFREIFGRQPIAGRWWMWIAVALLVIPIGLRVAATNWSEYSVGVILTMLATGLCIGIAEELITRGIAVNLLRRAGHGERTVMVLSSLIFALMHTVNAFTQPLMGVAITVAYTFGMGVMLYLVLRVTGNIIWPILLHAATDPTTFLATGGLDAAGATSGSESLISLAGVFNYVYFAVAIVAIFLVKGKALLPSEPFGRPVNTEGQ